MPRKHKHSREYQQSRGHSTEHNHSRRNSGDQEHPSSHSRNNNPPTGHPRHIDHSRDNSLEYDRPHLIDPQRSHARIQDLEPTTSHLKDSKDTKAPSRNQGSPRGKSLELSQARGLQRDHGNNNTTVVQKNIDTNHSRLIKDRYILLFLFFILSIKN